jgi:uncharacterized coiled-coil protein SlyX
LTFAWTATEPQSNFPSYINAAYADDGSLRVAIRGKAHLDDEGEGPGFSAVVVLPSSVASEFFYALGALSLESLAAQNAALRKRLEVSDDHGYDGISCRDETIRLQDDRIESLAAQLAEAQDRLERMQGGIASCIGGAMCRDKPASKRIAELSAQLDQLSDIGYCCEELQKALDKANAQLAEKTLREFDADEANEIADALDRIAKHYDFGNGGDAHNIRLARNALRAYDVQLA